MRIKRAQLAAFGPVARLDSEAHIFELLEQHFRETSVWTSDEGVRATVQAAVDKAAGYGMPSARDAFKMAVLMLVFGPSFDHDEPWAWRILDARAGKAPVGEMLYRAGIERIQELEVEALRPR